MKLHNNGILLLRTQLSLAILPIIVIPVALIGYFSYNVSYHALQARSIANVQQISSLASQNLDNTLHLVIDFAKTPLYDQSLQQIITYYSQHPAMNAGDVSFQDMQAFENFTLSILTRNAYIASIDICTTDKIIFSQTLFYGLKPLANWAAQPWFSQLLHHPGHTMILPTHTLQSEFGNNSVFSVAQAVVNTNTFQPVGAIVMNLDTPQTVERTIAASMDKTDKLFFIYGPDHQKIYASPWGSDATTSAFYTSAQHALQQGKTEVVWDNTDYFLSSSTSSLSGLTVMTLVPSASLTQDIAVIQQLTILMILFMLIIGLSSTFYVIGRISRQVTQLRNLMLQVEQGNLDVRFQARGRSEIALLGRSFNHMVAHLALLIRNDYESQLQRKKAELAALQSKINPHFLYNTLGMFQMMALMENQERLAGMIFELGQLMRYALESEALVELERELEHVQHFLSLMQTRYRGRLSFTIQVSEILYLYKLPKFTLQPIIENAIYHGIDMKVEGGMIQVNGYQRDQQLILEIIDNGVGIPYKQLQQLQETLSYETNILKRSQHMGILNVQSQIQSIFGPVYGLTITSVESGGLKVTVCLPLCEQDEAIREEQP
jgi:two-component system sensor histidine kinase YesM